MAASLLKTCNTPKNNISINLCFLQLRNFTRGKNPAVARSLQQRLEELDPKDPNIHFKVDIGFPKESVSRSKELYKRLDYLKKNRNSQLEKLAREKKLSIDLKDVKNEWLKSAGPYQIKKIAEHYGVFEHLFGDAYFVPRVPLTIHFQNENLANPVFYGNVIKPLEAKEKPIVFFEEPKKDEGSLYTLILTNPDGHLTKENAEYCHWFVGNIPGNDISKGETIVNYLQPFPPKGTGYHRYIFILYKQNKKINFDKFKIKSDFNLDERTFSTLEFYRERQDVLTPSSLAFFQSNWDSSLTEFFHKKLNMLEPIFEYDFPKPYLRPQEWFPKKRPFNLYMEKYMDIKKINERYFKDKLKNIHPFKPPGEKIPFPNAEPFPKDMPSWLKTETMKNRLGWGRINDV